MPEAILDTQAAEPVQSDNQPIGNVTEPVQPDNRTEPEGQTVEGQSQAAQAPQKQESQYYSVEELNSGRSFTEFDTTRMPKAMKDAIEAHRNLQAEYTKVRQVQTQPQQPQVPQDPKTAYANQILQFAEKGDHVSVRQMVNSIETSIRNKEGLRAQAAAEMDADRVTALNKSISEDVKFKNEVDYALAQSYQDKALFGNLDKEIDSEITRQIPDFKKIAPDLGKFMMKDRGMPQIVIENMLDARVYVDGIASKYKISKAEALEIAKLISIEGAKFANSYYNQASGKVFKDNNIPNPPKVESGANIQSKNQKEETLSSLRDKAIKSRDTDDWAKYYDAKSKS